MKKILLSIIIGLTATCAWAEAPKGWVQVGTEMKSYALGVDSSCRHGQKPSAFVKSTKGGIKGWSGLAQHVSADQFRGKHVRFSAWVKTVGAEDYVGLWMNVSGSDGKIYAFDNMKSSHRALSGDTDWKHCSIVLDVPAEAKWIGFGLVISKEGQAWVSECSLEPVGSEVPVTAPEMNLTAPVNLDFTQ